MNHGTNWTYRQGCRCRECKAAKALTQKRYAAKKAGRPAPKTAPKKLDPSEEQIEEAWNRWVKLMPVSDPELDSLLHWANHEAGESVMGGNDGAARRKGGKRLSPWERVAVRLLLAGRTGPGRAYQSPRDGLLAQRWREITEGKNVPTSRT